MLQWLQRRRQAEGLAKADAEALIRDHGAQAYGEARKRERDVILPDGTTPCRSDARALAARRLAHSRPPFARQGVRYSQSTR